MDMGPSTHMLWLIGGPREIIPPANGMPPADPQPFDATSSSRDAFRAFPGMIHRHIAFFRCVHEYTHISIYDGY